MAGGLSRAEPMIYITINQFHSDTEATVTGAPMSAQPIGDERYILRFPGQGEGGGKKNSDGPPEAGWTLDQCYDAWFAKFVETNRAATTLSNDRTALRHWARYVQEKHALDLESSACLENPARVSAIDKGLLMGFRQWLQEQGQTNQSVRRVESTIRKILKEAVEREFLSKVPKLPKLPQKRYRPSPVLLEEVQSLIDASETATWPKRLPVGAPLFWRAVLFAAWTVGFRTQDCVGLRDRTVSGLLWSEVVTSQRCPDASIRNCLSPCGWFDFTPRKTRLSCGLSVLLPIHPALAPLIEQFRGLDAQRVFPVPRSGDRFGRQFRAIREAAGVSDDVSIAGDGRGGRRSIRKGCRNNWDNVELGLGEIVVPHSDGGVDAASYRQALPKIAQRIAELPVPRLPD